MWIGNDQWLLTIIDDNVDNPEWLTMIIGEWKWLTAIDDNQQWSMSINKYIWLLLMIDVGQWW